MPTRQQAINAYCRECICDEADYGTWRQQVTVCAARDCPLYPYRPIADAVPDTLLVRWNVSPMDLDQRARAVIKEGSIRRPVRRDTEAT